MKAVLLFPGQGSQFEGMGKYLLDNFPSSSRIFNTANSVLGFDIKKVMCEGTVANLQQTKVTQNAIFIYSYIALQHIPDTIKIQAAAGHSLGEFTALVAAGVLQFEEALRLVNVRAQAMQKACEECLSTMAAVLGMEDEKIIAICEEIKDEVVVPANFNCLGQVVISGSIKGIEIAKEKLLAAGAKRVLALPVGGAFHSPLMQSAQDALQEAIMATPFNEPTCPVYQNVTAQADFDLDHIRQHLISQITGSVMWTQTIQQMWKDGFTTFVEVGPGKVLQGLMSKIIPSAKVHSWEQVAASH